MLDGIQNEQEHVPEETSEEVNRARSHKERYGPGLDAPELDRLPPPAFPPGSSRRPPAPARNRSTASVGRGDGFPEGAFISPDEPIRRIDGGFPEGALISPDDPIRSRRSRTGSGPSAASHLGMTEDDDDGEVEVTGIGDQNRDYYSSALVPARPDITATQVAAILEQLALMLRKGEHVPLQAESRLSPFESMLRGFISGYLVSGDDSESAFEFPIS